VNPGENIYRGRAGEFLAAFILEQHGLRTTHVDLPGDDLWCSHPRGHLIRVQVKSASRASRPKDRKIIRYNFKVGTKHPYNGVFIIAAMDLKLCLACTWDDIPPSTYKVDPIAFTKDAQSASIKKEFDL
jgi:hypothetical protein